jgi:neutral amino acid transport system permease protein
VDFSAILADAARAAIGPVAIVYALAAIGLNVHFGYTGLLNFGQVGFMLLGAYGVAIGVAVFGWPLWAGALMGIAASVVLALLLGIPTLRLRADYLAIVTIAAGEILRYLFRAGFAEPLTGSVFGLQRFADDFYALNPIPQGTYGIGRFAFSDRTRWVMVVGWILVALACLLVYALSHSPWGRVLRSIREDEDAARSLGKNVFGYKLQSLVLGGVLGAIAGMLLAISNQAVNPDTYNPLITFYAYTIMILGGAGRVAGPVIGSVIFWFIVQGADTFLRQAIGTIIPTTVLAAAETGAVRFALVGLGLMLLMIFRPQGIFGDREEMLLDAR